MSLATRKCAIQPINLANLRDTPGHQARDLDGHLTTRGQHITAQWVPTHFGIGSSKRADPHTCEAHGGGAHVNDAPDSRELKGKLQRGLR